MQEAGALPGRIGPYVILGLLGEGASGRVYLARDAALPREIALKVLRTPTLPAEARSRFAREADLLARLAHPNIARLYAAGVAESDAGPLSYLAMERIEGRDLLAWANASPAPDLDARLAVLAAIARAVHHAHSRGIVHRDLKPANILVDAQGQPHVLDFGVARLLMDEASATREGQVLGSVPYMSREQLLGARAFDDPRLDVYALGVIGYQLLSGALPYPGLSDSPVIEAIALLRETHVERLSRRLPQARGDTETVVMKAMAPEPAQRYGSAAELADDLERVRQRQPITARPPTAGYVLGLFVRRHRALAAALAFAALVLVAASAISLRYGMREARARAQVELRAQQLEAANGFIDNILAGSDPEMLRTHPPSLREFLDEARASLDGDRTLPPAVRAMAGRTVALVYAHSGDVAIGLQQIEAAQAALDATASPDAYTRNRLRLAHAQVLASAGRHADALAQLRPLLGAKAPGNALSRRLWLEARAQAVTDTAGLGRMREAAADAATLQADATRWLAGNDRLLLDIAFQQAELRHQSGDGKGALADFDTLLPRLRASLGAGNSTTLSARLAQAAITREQGDFAASERLARALMADADKALGTGHPLSITSRYMLAAVLQSRTPDSAEAVALMREVLARYQAKLGPDHPYTFNAKSTLSMFLQKQGAFSEATALAGQALASMQKQGFADGPETLPLRNAYALGLMREGRLQEACQRFGDLLARAHAALGDGHLQTVAYATNAAECLQRSRRPGEALVLLDPIYRQAAQSLGAAHPQTVAAGQRLAEIREALERRQ